MANYSSVAEVVAQTRHLLDGAKTFDESTTPPRSDVLKFLTYTDAALNSALATAGFATPITDTDVKPALDAWATAKAALWVEMTQRGVGYSDEAGSRTSVFASLSPDAHEFVKQNMVGWKRLGATMSINTSDGLSYTGLDRHSQRSDPDNTTREQPMFRRRKWDYPGTYTTDEDEDGLG